MTEAGLDRWYWKQLIVLDNRVFVCPCTGNVYQRSHVRQHCRSRAHRAWIETFAPSA